MRAYLLVLALALGNADVVAAEPRPAELSPEQEAAALRTAETMGATIYRHDRAAAIATDAALKTRAFKRDKRVKGWITEEQGNHILVTFIDQTPAALHRIKVSDSGIDGGVVSLESPASLSVFESGAAAARTLAAGSGFEPCSDKYNSVVLPDQNAPGNWTVYMLPGTTNKNLVPIGGTYRIDTDGKTIISRRGFTRTCISLQNDARAIALMITHLLDPTPTEAHVFWNLWSGKPLYVSTPPDGSLWEIQKGKVTLQERGSAKD